MKSGINILDRIAIRKRVEVENRKRLVPVNELEESVHFERSCYSLARNIQNSDTGIIAEFKRKSPSKGDINATASATAITYGYELSGAAGISVLTDEEGFGGKLIDLNKVRTVVDSPILRKDFILDEYQLFEAKANGADVVLLIAAMLDENETKRLARRANELGLEVLLEIHQKNELVHYNEFVDLVGVNNRDLTTFQVSIETSLALIDELPVDSIKISESGIDAPETIQQLKDAGYNGFLLGETFMRNENPVKSCAEMIEQLTKLQTIQL